MIEIKPKEGDFVIFPGGKKPKRNTLVTITGGGLALFSGEGQDTEAREYIKNRMERDNFYPTVWMKNDRGDLIEIDVWKEE